MAFDVFSTLTPFNFLLLIVFILFVLSLKKVMEIVKNALIIAAAAVVFPIVANRILGLPVPMDGDTIIAFVVAGISCYFIYLIAHAVYTLLKKGGAAAKKVMPDLKLQKKKVKKAEPEDEEKEDKKERPDLIKKQLAAKKTNKDVFKDYAEIKDEEPVKKESRNLKHGIVDEKEEEEKDSLMEPLKEIKFKKKKK